MTGVGMILALPDSAPFWWPYVFGVLGWLNWLIMGGIAIAGWLGDRKDKSDDRRYADNQAERSYRRDREAARFNREYAERQAEKWRRYREAQYAKNRAYHEALADRRGDAYEALKGKLYGTDDVDMFTIGKAGYRHPAEGHPLDGFFPTEGREPGMSYPIVGVGGQGGAGDAIRGFGGGLARYMHKPATGGTHGGSGPGPAPWETYLPETAGSEAPQADMFDPRTVGGPGGGTIGAPGAPAAQAAAADMFGTQPVRYA